MAHNLRSGQADHWTHEMAENLLRCADNACSALQKEKAASADELAQLRADFQGMQNDPAAHSVQLLCAAERAYAILERRAQGDRYVEEKKLLSESLAQANMATSGVPAPIGAGSGAPVCDQVYVLPIEEAQALHHMRGELTREMVEQMLEGLKPVDATAYIQSATSLPVPECGTYSMPHFSRLGHAHACSEFMNVGEFRIAFGGGQNENAVVGRFDRLIDQPMHLMLVTLDETQYWSESITERAGRVYGTYLVDLNERTFCCEITPSYCLEPLYSSALLSLEEEDQDQKLYDEITEGHDACDNDPRYFHCRVIDTLPASQKYDLGTAWISADESREDAMQELVSYYRSNVLFQLPHNHAEIAATFEKPEPVVLSKP